MRHSIIFTVMALTALGVSARRISESEARAIAADKLTFPDTPSRVRAWDASHTHQDAAPLYIFNSSQGGFVVIAGDDCMPNMVLAYSPDNTLDIDNCPPAMRKWLDEMSAFIEAADFSSVAILDMDFSTEVAPMIETKWNQLAPFNLLTPIGSGGSHCPTGCAATALAQVLKYWEYPAEGGLCEHSCQWNDQTLYVDFRNSRYDWSVMANVYPAEDDLANAANLAVATLMYECGVAIDMDYSEEGSGAYPYSSAYALTDIFGYSKAVRLRYRDMMTDEEWFGLLKGELDAGRPVLFTGQTEALEGHAFVCDGYDSAGLFHINWGWGGFCDGYFDVNTLQPTGQGTGGASSGNGFSCSQAIVTHACLPSEDDVEASGWEMGMDNFAITVENSDATTFSLYFEIYNKGYKPFEGSLGIYLYEGEEPQESDFLILSTYTGERAIAPQHGKGFLYNQMNAQSFADGIWHLDFMAIPYGSDEMVPVRKFRTSAEPVFEIREGAIRDNNDDEEEEDETTGLYPDFSEPLGLSVEIYTITGIPVCTSGPLAPGMYIRRQGGTTSKFIVR